MKIYIYRSLNTYIFFEEIMCTANVSSEQSRVNKQFIFDDHYLKIYYFSPFDLSGHHNKAYVKNDEEDHRVQK